MISTQRLKENVVTIFSCQTFALAFLFFLSPLAQSTEISNDEYLRAPFYDVSERPHQITFLHTGLASLQARLDVIESAQETLEVEYFIYQADMVGRILAQAMIRRAQEGVHVRVMFDTFLTGGQIDEFHVHEFEKYGVEVRYYNTTPLINIADAQYRNHRKLIVADDRVAITGGRNIQDEYFDLSSDFNYTDRDIIIEGPIVKTMRESFDAYWDSEYMDNFVRPERPSRSDLRYMRGNRSGRHTNNADVQRDINRWESRVAEAQDFFIESDEDRALIDFTYLHSRAQMQSLPSGQCNEVTFASDVPGIGSWARYAPYRKASEFVFEAMDNAQERILIESPYFILNEQSTGVIDRALERNVDFDVLTNSLHSTDALYVSAAFFNHVNPLTDRGLRAHIFRGEPLVEHSVPAMSEQARWGIHAKSMVFDDDLFMVGTFNFDPRSKYWSSELAVFCRDANLTSMLEESIAKRKRGSILIDSPEKVKEYELYQTGALKRLGYYLIYIPANLLDFLL